MYLWIYLIPFFHKVSHIIGWKRNPGPVTYIVRGDKLHQSPKWKLCKSDKHLLAVKKYDQFLLVWSKLLVKKKLLLNMGLFEHLKYAVWYHYEKGSILSYSTRFYSIPFNSILAINSLKWRTKVLLKFFCTLNLIKLIWLTS